MSAMHYLGHLLLVAVLLWPGAAPASDPARPARAAAAPTGAAPTGAAPTGAASIVDLTARAERGDKDAVTRLCELSFNASGGSFEAPAAVAWCSRAAQLGDAAATQRMGLLALAGIGNGKDLEAAARLCAEGATPAPTLSAGFCLAAVAAERKRDASAASEVGPAALPKIDSTLAAQAAAWSDQARRGDRKAAARLCAFYFGALGGPLEPAEAAEWCRRAAAYGDAAAMQRLGLMRLWGVVMEKSTPQAEAFCAEAQSRDPAVPAGFCLAAVEQQRARAAAVAAPSHFAAGQAPPETPAPTSVATSLARDRALESVSVTETGLQFNCRDILKWARYETPVGLGILTADSRAFGRPIVEYREQDYAALDRAATGCATALAPHDRDGSERRLLAEFRRMLPLLKARQSELERQRLVHQADVPRCVEAMRRSRADAERLGRAAGQIDAQSADVFSCTMSGRSQPVAAEAPAATPQRRPAERGR